MVQDRAYVTINLIANRKSYTGSRLPLRSMTLDDLEHKNRGFMDFWRFWAVTHISRAAAFTRDGVAIWRM